MYSHKYDPSNGNGHYTAMNDDLAFPKSPPDANDLDFSVVSDFSKRKNIYANRYQDTSRRFRGFWSLMRLWKGSVLKLVWHDLLVFLVAYAILSILYRLVFFHDPVQREYFELICVYASR